MLQYSVYVIIISYITIPFVRIVIIFMTGRNVYLSQHYIKVQVL